MEAGNVDPLGDPLRVSSRKIFDKLGVWSRLEQAMWVVDAVRVGSPARIRLVLECKVLFLAVVNRVNRRSSPLSPNRS
jgi:hypothetical protein